MAAGTPPAHAPTIEVAGRPLSASALLDLASLRIDLALGLPGRAVLRFNDAGYQKATDQVFRLGAKVVLKVRTTTVMVGEVTAIGLEQTEGAPPELVVTVDDGAHRMRSVQGRALTNFSVRQIVGKIASEAQLTLETSVLDTALVSYLLQVGSGLQVLDEICLRAGLVWRVEPTDRLVVTKVGTSTQTVKVRLGTAGLHTFSVRATASGAESVTVRGWDAQQQQPVVGAFQTPKTRESAFVNDAAGRMRGSGSPVALSSASPLDAGEAGTIARARFEESASASVKAVGTGWVDPTITLTSTVEVADAGPASGKYVVSEVEHTYTRTGFRTRFTAGPVRPSGLVDLLGHDRSSSGSVVEGVFAAVVSDVKDPDGQGRVKVAWKVVGDEVDSAWARVVSPGAGASRGMVWLPEVSDEVLIAFEHRDPRKPVVLGGLFSAKNALPTKDSFENDKVKFRRLTSRLGHVVELADGTGAAEQHVLIMLNGKKDKIRLGADKLEVVTDGTPISLTNGQATVTLAANGDITLDGNNITLKAKAEVKVTAGTKATVKGTTGVAVQGLQVQVKADTTGSVEASGPLTLKGATVAIN